MIAILLCGGYGTRLHPLTKNTPKGLLDVAGKPVLDYILPQLLEIDGLKSIHLVANARFFGQFYGWQKRWQRDLAERGVQLHLYSDASLEEERRLGSVGDLSFVLRALDEPGPALLIGDGTIVRFPLRSMIEASDGGPDNVVLAFHEPSHQLRQRLTILEFGEGDVVAHFDEHPENPRTEWASPLLCLLQPDALRQVKNYLKHEGAVHDSLTSFMDYLAQVETVRAIRIPERDETRTWFDIESKYMYKRANEVLSEEPLILEGLF